MLDKETKKRIDRCRDILVGQLPLPSDQVELITIALIYKFMDDIDEISYRIGGKKEFFTKELKELSWLKIIGNDVGTEERVAKFIQGIETLQKAKHIPELFSSIFKNTFLKFRDGRILKMFLDEINNFKYSHSEELGNAFEYLLMSMGTQGENGQFRTPRHIIDFITEVVDPEIDDSILDPACGTAGFLISAYKHILHKNTTGWEDYRVTLKNKNPEGQKIKWGDKLTSAQRKRITENIMGYDITPLMVRLSKVNMYLHQFPNPHIFEYDTLTNDSSWGKSKDCILANPPFMTPKGGVTPHSQFRIKANKTEVLFTDFIMEHLSYTGKAGIIVPEGIIFQNTNDYVDLRKWLINENLLWAVASLPANVFQPYSGVKTSILFVDKNIARMRNEILLVKINNDGFSLNTNRTEIEANDLPDAYRALTAFKKSLLTKTNKGKWQVEERKPNGRDKKILTINGSYNILTKEEFAKLDSYKASSTAYNLIRRNWQKCFPEEEKTNGKKNVVNEPQEKYQVKQSQFENFKDLTGFTGRKPPKDEKHLKEWFNENLKSFVVQYGALENQNHITPKLKTVLDNQREFNLSYDRNTFGEALESFHFEKVRIGDLAEVVRGSSPRPKGDKRFFGGNVPRLMVADVTRDGMITYPSIDSLTEEGAKQSRPMKKGDVVIAVSGNPGLPTILGIDACIHDGFAGLRNLQVELIDPYFLYFILLDLQSRKYNLAAGAVFQNLTTDQIRETEIPLPPLFFQKSITKEFLALENTIIGLQRGISSFYTANPFNHFLEHISGEDYETHKLGDIVRELKMGFAFGGGRKDDTNGFAHVRPHNITPEGTYTEEGMKHIPMDVAKQNREYLIKAGDILFNNTNSKELVGKTCFITKDLNAVYSNHITRIRVNEKLVNPQYLAVLLQNKQREGVFLNLSNKWIGQAGVNTTVLSNIDIELPTLKEQNAIVKDLQEDLATIEATKKLKTKMEAKIKSVINKVWGVEEKVTA